VFSIDPATGLLSRHATTILSNAPGQIAVELSGKWIYVTESGAVRGFSVSGSGLTELPGSPFAAATVGLLSAVTPGGRYLINVGNGQAAVFAIDPATGAPVAISGSPFATGTAGEQSVAISPNGSFLFILTAGSSAGDVVEMTIAPNGSLAVAPECHRTSPKTVGCTPPLGPVGARQGISGVPGMVVDPSSQYLYLLAADSSGATRVVSLGIMNGGGLTSVPGSPFAQNIAPNSMAMDSAGKSLFLGTQGTIFTYTTAPGAGLRLSSTPGFIATTNLVSGP
jgi:hypothetical protein